MDLLVSRSGAEGSSRRDSHGQAEGRIQEQEHGGKPSLVSVVDDNPYGGGASYGGAGNGKGNGNGVAQEQHANNPFRDMEKRFQLHYDQVFTIRKGKRRLKKGRSGKFKERPTDLSEVIDFESLDKLEQDRWTELGISEQKSVEVAGSSRGVVSVYTMSKHPGFFFVRGFLDKQGVERLAGDIVTEYIEPPASSNHTKKYGNLHQLWKAAQSELYLSETRGEVRSSDDDGGNANVGLDWSPRQTGTSAQQLLAKLRWASLGPQFDWTNRVYRDDIPYRELPGNLKSLAEHLVRSLGVQTDYNADAALLNFYGSKDTLGGHKDDAELDLRQPLVSMSLGCEAIFLLGHLTKEEAAPTAMLVRSGDIVVLSGQARSCYHGVPRIFAQQRRDGANPNSLGIGAGEGLRRLCVQNYLANHRINVSVRMVREAQRTQKKKKKEKE